MSEKKLQPVRGTKDLLGDELQRHHYIINTASSIAQLYGFSPIQTPIFEYTPVFKRSIGETSDIVGKEMYTFLDRGQEELTLRPEGTASVIRAIISNGLTQTMPQKLYYHGPMFRYERPQLGRYRQLHQWGMEYVGIDHPFADIETLGMAAQLLKALGLLERTTLEINTLGDQESRDHYRQALVSYFTPFEQELSEDSKIRLKRNPLRILDSKDDGDQKLCAEAPSFTASLNAHSQRYFETVCNGLTALGIAFYHNPRLVRGLDYYTHTAFEFTTSELGSQSSVLAGGRYNQLMSLMGGPEVPGIGWGMGIDRIALMLTDYPALQGPIAIINVGEEYLQQTFNLAMQLRQHGLPIEMTFKSNLSKQMKQAHKINAQAALILGETEWANNQAIVKNFQDGSQETVTMLELAPYLMRQYFQHKG